MILSLVSKSLIGSIFVHFKLCNAHHLFLLTENSRNRNVVLNHVVVNDYIMKRNG